MSNEMQVRMSKRWQEIKYSRQRGVDSDELMPYVRYQNQRIYLENFMRGDFREESKLARVKIHGAAGTSYFSAYLIHLSEDGEYARVGYAHW